MSRSGIVNVRMVITEEKIISNIDKVQKMINPKNKKQIVQLEEDIYFKDLIESIKTYLIEYPKKKNFPINVYNAAYDLVEFAINKKREKNIALAGELSDLLKSVDEKEDGWKDNIEKASDKFSEDIIEALNTIGRCKGKTSQKYKDSMKLIKAKINNLEANLHIEIDMERLEDSSKALSFIGIEISDALKLIPTPEEKVAEIKAEEVNEEPEVIEPKVKTKAKFKLKKEKKQENTNIQTITEETTTTNKENKNINDSDNDNVEEMKQQYLEETTFETKPSLWYRIKHSKVFLVATYVFRIKIRIELPPLALPEGDEEEES